MNFHSVVQDVNYVEMDKMDCTGEALALGDMAVLLAHREQAGVVADRVDLLLDTELFGEHNDFLVVDTLKELVADRLGDSGDMEVGLVFDMAEVLADGIAGELVYNRTALAVNMDHCILILCLQETGVVWHHIGGGHCDHYC